MKLASTIQVSLFKYSVKFFLAYDKVYSFPYFIVFCSFACWLSWQP